MVNANLPRDASATSDGREVCSAETAQPPLRILIADDNMDSVVTLAYLLQAMGHVVCQANDGVVAVEKAVDFAPDLILLDIGMPRLNGYEACRKIRSLDGHPRPTIVALTGWGQPNDRRFSEEAGFDKHIVKPIGLPELDAVLLAATMPAKHIP